MTVEAQGEATAPTERNQSGESNDSNRLFESLYSDLHRLAQQAMAREPKDHTLQPTALLHEVWLRLVSAPETAQNADRDHLLHLVAGAMRHVVIDHARRRRADKRSGKRRRVPLDDVLDYFVQQGLDVQEFKDALIDLERLDKRKATIVTLRKLGGYTVNQVAELLDVSPSTVEKDYRWARAWLYRELKEDL
jgi:RNA polymerase sigma factor (TIGR02999 family)